MDEDDDLTVEDIERVVNVLSAETNGTKDMFQVRKELEEVDEFIQEFSRAKWSQSFKSEDDQRKC